MSRKSSDLDAARKQSPEFQKFETAMKRIVAVSKDEIEKRLADDRKSRRKS